MQDDFSMDWEGWGDGFRMRSTIGFTLLLEPKAAADLMAGRARVVM